MSEAFGAKVILGDKEFNQNLILYYRCEISNTSNLEMSSVKTTICSEALKI